MVEIGRSKYDNNGRITLVKEVADLMNLSKGDDYVVFNVIDGELIVRKETKKYAGGLDFETKEIKDNLQKYEMSKIDEIPDESDPEKIEEIAWQQYQKDKAEREAKKNKR